MKSEITVEYIEYIHRYAICINKNEIDLADAVRSEADLERLCEMLSETDDCIRKAAIALYRIACYHPFVEGNKRTALLVCENLLDNDIFINADEDAIYRFVLDVACDKKSIDEIEDWLRNNTEQSLAKQSQ